MTHPNPIKTFEDCARTAIKSTPGGRLTDADEIGLIRRARNMGLTDAQARQAINAAYHRPRHPVTRGIE